MAASPAVLDAARRLEFDRYLAALLAPASVRDDLMALAAMIGEINQIPVLATNPEHSLFRLQWWRDALGGFDPDKPTGHPIADPFGFAIKRYDLPVSLVFGMLDAAANNLNDQPFTDDAALRGHLAKSETAGFLLAARITGASSSAGLEQAALDGGTAYGLARLLHRLPADLARGDMPLPATLTAGAGVTPETLSVSLDVAPVHAALVTGVARLAGEAAAAHRRIAAGLGNLPKPARTALLPAILAPLYLQLVRQSRDPLREQHPIPPLGRLTRLLAAHSFGRFG